VHQVEAAVLPARDKADDFMTDSWEPHGGRGHRDGVPTAMSGLPVVVDQS
jgi:hypothetical protein